MKSILITGASGGIGSAIAKELAEPECSLFLHYYENHAAIKELALACEEKGANVTLIRANLAANYGDRELLASIEQMTFHTIIHNAGTSLFGLFTEMSNKELMDLMNIHLLNPMKITQSLLPNMIQRREGKIVVISSIWGLAGASCEVAYSAAKGGLNSFVKGLAKEVAPSNIQVNGVAPGAIQTKMHEKLEAGVTLELEDEIPANRIGMPKDVAHAVSFLCSDKADYINGQILSVNGAWYC